MSISVIPPRNLLRSFNEFKYYPSKSSFILIGKTVECENRLFVKYRVKVEPIDGESLNRQRRIDYLENSLPYHHNTAMITLTKRT